MRGSEEQQAVKRRAIGLLLVVLCAVGALVSVSGRFLEDPGGSTRRLRVWWLGAEFGGFEGVVLQEAANDCGPAALKMVLDEFGIERSLSQLRKVCGLSRRGTTLLRLAGVARDCGLTVRGVRMEVTHLDRVRPPLLAYLSSGHFVVIDGRDRDGMIRVRDPALGLLRFSPRGLTRTWRGEALLFSFSHQPASGAG